MFQAGPKGLDCLSLWVKNKMKFPRKDITSYFDAGGRNGFRKVRRKGRKSLETIETNLNEVELDAENVEYSQTIERILKGDICIGRLTETSQHPQNIYFDNTERVSSKPYKSCQLVVNIPHSTPV